ncbi:MgtC/SapB family protein [Thermomonas sp.]|uniref:MgtC/SapB family protein n=1 Tax=Thermomonas sp. TaxID=1971895 RepID=UPI0035B471CF
MIAWWEMGLRLLLAALLGAVIGINREHHEWAAGLRTHMLVCVGAALTVLVSAFGFTDLAGQAGMVLDPSRIAAQVVSGIGFLCAGTILFLQREQVIRGLTTAAGLWAVASIGLAVGAGLYAAAGMTTLLLWGILALLKPIEQRYLHRRPARSQLRLHVLEASPLAPIEAALADAGLAVSSLTLRRNGEGAGVVDIECVPPLPHPQLLAQMERLSRLPGVTAVELHGNGNGK